MTMPSQQGKNNKLDKGYIHVYTGDGKGKTTAAIGLSIRAAGAGLRVLFAQFIKGAACSEIAALEFFPGVLRSGSTAEVVSFAEGRARKISTPPTWSRK